MMRLPTTAWLCAFVLSLLSVAAGDDAAGTARGRPDIVVFLTDDLSQLDSSPYGARKLRTPNMQRLADAGMTFTHAFVASPSCAPSRAALLTGLLPARNGAEANHSRPGEDIKKLPAYFRELGYDVASFGKVGHYQQTRLYGFEPCEHFAPGDHEGIPRAVEFLRKRPRRPEARPLCLFVGTHWPHVPWPTDTAGYDPAELPLPAGSVDTPETREWQARYVAAVTKADDALGEIYDTARETLGADTLFLFSSDHGAQWPFGKWNLYDAGIRVPLFVVWPKHVKPGTRTSAMVSWVDVLPTLLEAAGGAAPAEIDGRSFLPVLRGDTSAHRDRIFTTHSCDGGWNIYPIRSVRTTGWKYILNLHPEFAYTTHIDLQAHVGTGNFWASWEAAAKKDKRAADIVSRYHARPAEELYNLADDPHEERNLAADPQHAERLASMRAELEAWLKSQGDGRNVFVEPRLLSDPNSFGPTAQPPASSPKPAPGQGAKP